MMRNSIEQERFEQIRRWQQSGLSQKVWCENNKMAYANFHYWYKRYREQAEVVTENSSDDFIKLTVDDRIGERCWCELIVANGQKLIFQQPVSAEFLKTLIA